VFSCLTAVEFSFGDEVMVSVAFPRRSMPSIDLDFK